MDVLRLRQARPDMAWRQRSEADAEDDGAEMESAPAAPVDLYDVVGDRGSQSTVTTHQWLSMRCISF